MSDPTSQPDSGRRLRKEYPPHLAAVEQFDSVFLRALISFTDPVTTRILSDAVHDETADADIARSSRLWTASAEWRGLITSGDEPLGDETFKINGVGRRALGQIPA